jgi:hypothetical protein
MKTIMAAVLLALIIGFLGAADTESYEFIDRLLNLSGPGAPEIFEDAVIFTASSARRRVGIAFAHEGFSRVHWFRKLLVPQDPEGAPIPKGRKVPEPYRDSGILFYVQQIPENTGELEYRLIIDGLWTADPANTRRRTDPVSGLASSVVSLPMVKKTPGPLNGPPGALHFAFKGPPGETVTVGGSFNGWDPYMYELRENPPGYYTLTLPMPPGRYQYVFFHRGERRLDPYNSGRVYTKEGKTASEIVIQ